jgi:hypothetical protein
MLARFLDPNRVRASAASPLAVLPPAAIKAMDVIQSGHIEITST